MVGLALVGVITCWRKVIFVFQACQFAFPAGMSSAQPARQVMKNIQIFWADNFGGNDGDLHLEFEDNIQNKIHTQ